MKRLNKILIVFFAVTFLMVYGAWRFIHSRHFSDQASKKVSEILTKKVGAKLSFTGVDFNLFPPATVFKNVHLDKNDPKTADIDLNVEELSVSFTYSSFFASNLEIDDFDLKNGSLKIVTHKSDSPDIDWKNLNFKKLYEQYSDLLQKSPLHLNIARLENVKVQVDDNSLVVNTLSFAPHKKEVRLKLDASQVHIDPQMKDVPAIELDKVEALIDLTKDQWKVDNFKLEKDQCRLDLRATLFNGPNAIQANTTTTFNLNLEKLLKLYPKMPKEFLGIKGNATGSLVTHGALLDPDAEIALAVTKFQSEWINLDDVKVTAKKKKNLLIVEKLKAINNVTEQYELLKPVIAFDIKKSALQHATIPLNLHEAFTNTFLYAIRHSLEPVKGYLTGKVDIVWNGEKVFFEIHDKASVKNFKLLSSSKKPILQNAGFNFEDTTISLDEKYKVGVDAKVSMANTLMKLSGEITGKDLHISIKDSKIDMQAFGPISGLAITGAGPATAEIYGPMDDVRFDFDVDWNNFSVVDLNFGRVKSQFSLGLRDLQLDVSKLSGAYNQSLFDANGTLNFGDKSGMDLKINFQNTNFSDARKMVNLVFKNIKLPVIPEFNFEAHYNVHGGFGLDTLKVDGAIKGTDLKVFNEEAERISLNFILQNSFLTFKDVKINKSRGEINAGASINLTNNYTELEGNLQGLRLRDFNFYRKLGAEYDGDLTVDFDGNGTSENFSSRFKAKVNNPFIENIPASPSNAIFYLNSDEVVVNASLLSGKVKFDSLVNFKTRQVTAKSTIETTDVRELLGIVAGHNMSEKSISGKVKAQLNSQFNLDTLIVKKFFLDISQFNLRKGDMNILVDPRHNSVAVDEGAVKNWDLRFYDGDDYFISKAHNAPGGTIVYDQNFSLKTSLLEFVTNSLEKAVGEMKGSSQLLVDKKISITKFELHGAKNSLKIKGMPGAITDLDYSIVKKGNIFEIGNLVGKYGDGDFKVGGTFVFDDLYPQVNLDYKIERSTIPLFKRSSLLASSSGTITGTDLPYKLNGKVTLLHGEFLDDPNDFTKDNKVSLEEFKKYLPEKDEAQKRGYIDLNVSFDTANPILLKNNLAEVYAKASGLLVGDFLSPEVNGRIEVIPTVSKFKFKGHDFLLNQGNVEIRDRGKTRSSDLKFVGFAKVNDYDVKLDISGTIEKTNIALSSEPSLASEDLLSLLALGVTSDMSKNLEARDRTSVATVGVGALLVDQLKINEDLNSSLGLNLSVLPEFKEDETSLVTGKSAVSDGSTSRLKTATKIKIKKQINPVVDVSVSSTVGGSIEQTQEMNVNYNINKKWSLEGVYEVKPAEDGNTNTSTPNSIGADLKYKWSF